MFDGNPSIIEGYYIEMGFVIKFQFEEEEEKKRSIVARK